MLITGLHTYQSELQRERDFSGKILTQPKASSWFLWTLHGLIS